MTQETKFSDDGSMEMKMELTEETLNGAGVSVRVLDFKDDGSVEVTDLGPEDAGRAKSLEELIVRMTVDSLCPFKILSMALFGEDCESTRNLPKMEDGFGEALMQLMGAVAFYYANPKHEDRQLILLMIKDLEMAMMCKIGRASEGACADLHRSYHTAKRAFTERRGYYHDILEAMIREDAAGADAPTAA